MDNDLEACVWIAIRAARRASGPSAAAAAHRAAARAARELQREGEAHPDAPLSARAWEVLAEMLQTPNVHAAEAAAAVVVGSMARSDSASSAPWGDDLAVGAMVQAAAAHSWEPTKAMRTLAMAYALLLTEDVPASVCRAGRVAVAALVRTATRLPGPQDGGKGGAWQLARELAYMLLARIVYLDGGGAAAAEMLGFPGQRTGVVGRLCHGAARAGGGARAAAGPG
jgi:hypothetical protein